MKELEKHNVEARFSAIATNSLTSIQIAQAGGGICTYSKEMVNDINLKVVPILSDYLSTKIPIYITIQKFMDESTIINSFVSLLIKTFKHLE
ncbi:MAG: hypothetical protein BGO28_07470 [Alphaproteobacteria bacterium 43-37]|nr:MAG: hypothetical protein BGO28_07470 [Alphaproteobacteria bacterium 43-37]